MATTPTDNGLGIFVANPLNSKDSDLTTQTAMYFKTLVSNLPTNEFSDSDTYQSEAKENGLANVTTESNYYQDSTDYQDNISKNGSDILFVDQTQTGNQSVAETEDYKNLQAYLGRA